MSICLLVACLATWTLLPSAPAAAQNCASSHKKVGWQAKLTSDHHGAFRQESNATLSLKLRKVLRLDDLDYVSTWCIAFKANFAEGRFAAP